MSSKTLAERILAERELPEQTYAVIDVRDDGEFITQPLLPSFFVIVFPRSCFGACCSSSLMVANRGTRGRGKGEKITLADTSRAAQTCPRASSTP